MHVSENKTTNSSPTTQNCNDKNPFFQPKLTVNVPGDAYEQEADRVAEHVMRMPANDQPFFKPMSPTISSVQRKCKECQQDEKLHRKDTDNSQVPGISTAVEQTLQSVGQPIDEPVRSFMERRFNYDFSKVQIHNNSLAHQSSKDVSALAYTHGNHVVFGLGKYQPLTNEGRQLLAHELTHVVQQHNTSHQNIQREAQRYYSYTTADYVQQVQEALGQVNATAGVGNPAKAYAIMNEIETSQLEEVLMQLGSGNLSIIKDIDSPSHANSYRTKIFLKATLWILTSTELLSASEIYNSISQLDFLNQAQYNEFVKYIKRNIDLGKLFDQQLCMYKVTNNIPQLSYELADAPCANDVYTRVQLWFQLNLHYIEEAETRFSIDRRAIAGAIAWEAIENVRGSWTFSSVGPGKVHTKRHFYSQSHSGTVADQVEDAGYLPKQSEENRDKLLAQTPGAIIYIAAIMKAGADIAYKEGNFDISKDPVVLSWFYNSKDLPGWTELIKNKTPVSPFVTDENKMSSWVKDNLAFLEKAVGKPKFASPYAKKSTSPPAIHRKSKDYDNDEQLHRKPNPFQSPESDAKTTSYIQSLSAKGSLLSNEVRNFFEPRFGYNFSSVRLHTNDEANQSTKNINARAYTINNNIVFGNNEYQPNANKGKKLLAHELAHVVQQNKPELQKKTIQRSERCNHDGTCVFVDDGINQSIQTTDKIFVYPPVINKLVVNKPVTVSSKFPMFSRDAGCSLEAADRPTIPTPLPFVYDTKAQLPDKESAPDLNVLQSDKPWWNNKEAEAFGKALAECYAARTAKDKKAIKMEDKLAEFQDDFNAVVQGSFGRSNEFGTWQNLTTVLQKKLQAAQKNIVNSEDDKEKKLLKKDRRLPEEMKQEVEKQMQQIRHDLVEDVRAQVALGAWGWMAERRGKLDFDTLKMFHLNPSLPYPRLVENLSDTEIYTLAHDMLVTKKKELTDNEIQKIEESARKKKEDKIKKSKPKDSKPSPFSEPAQLTDEEKKEAIEKAEVARVINNWGSDLDALLLQERAKKEAPDLVVPALESWELDDETNAIIGMIARLRKILAVAKTNKERIQQTEKTLKGWRIERKDNQLKQMDKDFVESLNNESDETKAVQLVQAYIETLKTYSETVKESKEGNKINKNVAEVLQILEAEFPQGFRAGNYPGHGGGSFRGRFHSVDMYPNQKTSRVQKPFGEIGFFEKQTAFDFALAIDRAVEKKGGSFQILYNDFVVAREVNKAIKHGIMSNTDNIEYDANKAATNLNWHGPLVTHFHVDFVI